ncbi:MAG TPA: tRNA guanosine(34) transglycosylase Tgt [Nannocystaceae bacterium]|nr:tRNA guanosine(34) transglycosylase Tgt [Nannocystaceae bacterium]
MSFDPAVGLACDDASLAARPPGTFETIAQHGDARSSRLWTAHGPVDTPCFMPVGTYGAVKGIDPDELVRVGSQVVLGNSYHLAHRPGAARIAALGGLHAMNGWKRAILTDSGGFQVFSLRGLQKIDDDGVDYRTHFDGSKHRMTPQSVLEVQAQIGSDICMILDHCPPADAEPEALRAAVDRTTRWAERAADLRGKILAPSQLCFGIVQGAVDLALRREHLARMAALPFDGLALGGLSVGEAPAQTHATMAAIAPTMPADRPRYVMGIGTPADLLAAIDAGVDMFDCVLPTRNARNGQLFTFAGKLNIKRTEHKDDRGPADPTCGCPTCTRFSRAYLRHLHAQDDPLFGRLASLHNLWFFHTLVGRLRAALRAGDYPATRTVLLASCASAP